MAVCKVAAKPPPGFYLNPPEMAFATENERPHRAHRRAFVRMYASVFTKVLCKMPYLRHSLGFFGCWGSTERFM